jgi:AcrR family transcriptional regulator
MRGRDGQARQAEIADAILRVVGREGIAALTMERLGREMGLTSGALFRHFPTRAAMLNEAARRAVALLEATFPPASLPPLERLRQFLTARSALAAQHPGLPQLVFSEQFGKALPPKGARALRGVVLRTRDFLAEALAEAARGGELRDDLPPEELALVVLGSLLARALLSTFVPEAAGRQADREAAVDGLLRLLAPVAPSGRRSSKPKQGARA